MKKVIAVVAGAVFLAGTLAGCEKEGDSKGPARARGRQTTVLGRYVSQENRDEYLELRKDGTFFLHEGVLDSHGRWEISGQELRLNFPIGLSTTGKIAGAKIVDRDGVLWVNRRAQDELSRRKPRTLSPKEARTLGTHVGQWKDARRVTAKAQIADFKHGLEKFYIDVGRYPSGEEGLKILVQKPMDADIGDAWDGPYIITYAGLETIRTDAWGHERWVAEKISTDPWGHEYIYRRPGADGSDYDIICYGEDGVEGGEHVNKDITDKNLEEVGYLLAESGPLSPDAEHRVAAKAQILKLKHGLQEFYIDTARYPGAEEGLKALVQKPMDADIGDAWEGPYFDKIPKDPWGHEYIYRQPGADGSDFDIICYGKDGVQGGEDVNKDITDKNLDER